MAAVQVATRTHLVYHPFGCLYASHHVGSVRSDSALSTCLRPSMPPVLPRSCLQAHADPNPRNEARTRRAAITTGSRRPL